MKLKTTQKKISTPIIAEPNNNPIVPAKWYKPELFKTDFENTETGTDPAPFEGGSWHS